MPDYSKISRPGLIPVKIENQGILLTTQVNKINFLGSVSASIGDFNDITITVGIPETASFAISSSYALTASYLDNYVPPFPFTGSALITGSLGITGSFSTTNNVFLRGLINQTTPVSHVVTFDNTTGRLYITASSAFGGGGGGGSTPGGNPDTIQFNNAGVLDGSDNFKIVGSNFIYLTGSLLVTGSTFLLGPITGSSFTGSFTGSLLGTSSFSISSSQAISSSYAFASTSASYSISSSQATSASYAFNSTSASYSISSSQATSASYVSYDNIVEFSDLSRNTIASVKNVFSGTIFKGTPCYVTSSGTSGNVLGVVPADAGDPNLMPAGIIIAQTLNAGDEGLGYIDGFINGVDTSAFTSGDEVFVAVGGGYTNIKPTGSALIQPLGYVEKVDPTNGSGLINGPGHFFEVPNITSGYTWVGNFSQVATPTPTASFHVSSSISSSFANTASFVNPLTQSIQILGNTSITGSLRVSGSITGSLFGTASFATSSSFATSASQAVSASYAPVFPFTGSAIISGSLITTGSINVSENIVQSTMTQEFIVLPSAIAPMTIVPVVTKALTGPVSMFLEYQIVDTVTGTNQRTGLIMANFNNGGTPTNTHTEMVTGDIGNTSAVTFSTTGPTPYQILANNTSMSPYTFKAILKFY
jgi:hypothetical protein